ncbi:unnamed protein product [Leuciscus chuanchicus]
MKCKCQHTHKIGVAVTGSTAFGGRPLISGPPERREAGGGIDELHLHEISVKKGEELKLDVLLSNADKVVHQSKISTEWTEVWTRGHGVSSDRLTDRDGNLTINEFTANDTGTYRVLDYEGETLITVSVTESRTQRENDSKGKLDTDDDKTDGTEHPSK